MWHDVDSLHNYYATPLGRTAGHFLTRELARRWQPGRRLRLLGLGYTPPLMKPMTLQAERTILAMPGRQGAEPWTDRSKGKNQVALVRESALPFSTAAFDRIIAAHVLEVADQPLDCLAEAWRVLQPEGQMLLVLPNRFGLWARTEKTPFGLGSPYSPAQITRLLEAADFQVEGIGQALFFPPLAQRRLLRLASGLDRSLRIFGPTGGGALVVDARKRLRQPIRRPGLAQRVPSLWGWMPRPVPEAANGSAARSGGWTAQRPRGI